MANFTAIHNPKQKPINQQILILHRNFSKNYLQDSKVFCKFTPLLVTAIGIVAMVVPLKGEKLIRSTTMKVSKDGVITQLVEYLLCKQRVPCSSHGSSTYESQLIGESALQEVVRLEVRFLLIRQNIAG